MLKISKAFVTDNCSPHNPPVAQCQSGDTVIFETRDCYDDRLRGDGYVHEPEKALENPATGPLFVEGAEPGDVLKVEVLNIKLNPTGLMRASTSGGAFNDLVEYRKVRQFDTSGDMLQFNDKLSFPIDTMIGVIGTAPACDTVMTHTPGSHGGNMDCSRVRAGSTLYFPVACDGALLSMGDLHALMGDGEVFGYGLEAKGKVTVKVTVIKDHPVTCPIILDGNEVSTVGSGKTMEDATNECLAAMHSLLMKNGLNETEAGLMLSLKCNLISCQIVNPLFTMRAELPKEFFKLP